MNISSKYFTQIYLLFFFHNVNGSLYINIYILYIYINVYIGGSSYLGASKSLKTPDLRSLYSAPLETGIYSEQI